MSTYAYISYVDFSQNGNSDNYQEDSGTTASGTLTEAGSDGFFTSGEAFSSGEGGTFYGTYTDGSGNIYVVVQTSSSPNGTWRIYSSLDEAQTLANLPNTLDSKDVTAGGDIDQSAFAGCFLKGTLIATPTGETAVEMLQIGDEVLIAGGGSVQVKWIGRQTVATAFSPAERLMPVRFRAGSLTGNVPDRDLLVTADHGMLVDGVICHAGALVNGQTITRVPFAEIGDRFTVYHIETEGHEIILANGAPAETFIDNISRRIFDNYAEFEALYGDVPEMQELPYPRAMSARQVPGSIKSKRGTRGAA